MNQGVIGMLFHHSYDPNDPLIKELEAQKESLNPDAFVNALCDAAAKPGLKLSQIDYIFRTIDMLLDDPEKRSIIPQPTFTRIADAALGQLLDLFDHPEKYPDEDKGTFVETTGRKGFFLARPKRETKEYSTDQNEMRKSTGFALSRALLHLPERATDYLKLLQHSASDARLTALSAMPATPAYMANTALREQLKSMILHEPMTNASGPQKDAAIIYAGLLRICCFREIEETPALLRQRLTELKGSSEAAAAASVIKTVAFFLEQDLKSFKASPDLKKKADILQACEDVVKEIYPEAIQALVEMRSGARPTAANNNTPDTITNPNTITESPSARAAGFPLPPR